MKHAFLILAHCNWGQLQRLISLLDCKNHDIYLHVDLKSTDFHAEQLKCQYSRLFIFREYKVYWGGFVQVETELFLLEHAIKEKYDYYHIISGADLPLVTMKEFDSFFEAHNGFEFVSFDEHKRKNDPEISRRTRCYHFLQNYRRRYSLKALNAFFTFLEHCLLAAQIVLRVDRTKHSEWEIRYGSQWVSITHALALEIVKNKKNIYHLFSYTSCADELFIQTIMYNCGFWDKRYKGLPLESANCRFIDWERGSHGNPYTFRCQDYDMIRQQKGYLFARKFSETIDNEVIEKLCSLIKQS